MSIPKTPTPDHCEACRKQAEAEAGYRALRLGKLCFAWRGDSTGVLSLTGRSATFYGLTWRWLAFGFWVLK